MPSLNAIFKLNDQYSKTIDKVNKSTVLAEKSLLGASNKVDMVNQKFDKMTSSSSSAASGIRRLVSAMGGLYGVKKAMDISDEYTNTKARIDLVNDGLQTTAELQDNIFAAAQRSRGAYNTMAQSVAKLGMLAGDAFGSSQEIIDFTEMIQKSFKVGGASKTEQSSGMYQLTQAMASGKLQGDEFRSISENAPMISKALSKYLDVPIGKLKEMGSEGQLTSDIIKNAMFAMSDEINAQFDKIPRTWSDIGTSIQNHALKAFGAVIDESSNLINSSGFQAIVDGIKGGIDIIAQGFLGLISIISWIGQAIVDNWGVIEPILLAVAMVLIPFLIVKLWAMVTPVLVQAAAWLLVHWPILLVIGVIAILISILQEFGVSTNEIVGAVTGSFAMFFAILYNGFALCYNTVATFAEFIVNVFRNPVYAVKKLFWELSLYITEAVRGAARQIEKLVNSIPGVEINITSGLDRMVDDYKNKLSALEASNPDAYKIDRMKYKNLDEAYNSGYNWGSSAVDKISGIGSNFNIPGSDSMNLDNYMTNGALPVTNGKGTLDVSIDSEDLKYLKDIAERDYLVRYSNNTLAPQLQVTFGDVKETADVKQIKKVLEDMFREELAVVAEGV